MEMLSHQPPRCHWCGRVRLDGLPGPHHGSQPPLHGNPATSSYRPAFGPPGNQTSPSHGYAAHSTTPHTPTLASYHSAIRWHETRRYLANRDTYRASRNARLASRHGENPSIADRTLPLFPSLRTHLLTSPHFFGVRPPQHLPVPHATFPPLGCPPISR